MKGLLFLVVALFATQASAQCNSTQLETFQPITNCSFPGYNLAALTQVDLYGVESSMQYVYRLCGAVSHSLCDPDSIACRFGTDRNTCNNPSTTVNLINTDAVQSFGYINNNASLGLQIIQVTPSAGTSCRNSMNRTVITQIQCASGPAVPVPPRMTVSKVESGCTCTLTIVISSPLACPSNRTMPVITLSPPVTRLPCYMGQFGIDLSSQFSEDMSYIKPDGTMRYVVNLCRPTRDIGCNLITSNGASVSACVVNRCQNATATALMYSYNTPTWLYSNHQDNSDGYTMVNYVSASAMLTIRLFCDQNATTKAELRNIYTTATGQHHMWFATSLACVNETGVVLPQPRCNNTCCFMGYDFSPFQMVDITGYQNNGNGQPWSFTMCGAARTVAIGSCNGAMICQKPNCNGGAYPLAYYNQTRYGFIDMTFSWVNGLDWTGGVRFVTTNGQMCGSNPRSTIIEFICDPTAQFPRAGRVAEDAVCVYYMAVRTSFVCSKPKYYGGGANLGINNVTGSSVALVKPKSIFGCQFAGYDFSPLAQSDFHVKIEQYIFVARICGQQENVVCNANNNYNTSVCQIDYGCSDSNRGQYIVSVWNPYATQYKFVDGRWENGVQLRLMTGDECPGAVARSIVYQFVCDPDAAMPYQDQGYESPGSYICNYFMRIRTNIVCTPPPQSLLGNATVSSSSTGRGWYPTNDANKLGQSGFLLVVSLMVVAAIELWQ